MQEPMSFEQACSLSPSEEFGSFDFGVFSPKNADESDECPVCGVPIGTGGCPRCFLLSARIFEIEDWMDELRD